MYEICALYTLVVKLLNAFYLVQLYEFYSFALNGLLIFFSADENCEFLLELQLGNATTVFEGEVKMPDAGQQQRPSRLETEYFTFGAFEWNVSIDLTQGDGEYLPC